MGSYYTNYFSNLLFLFSFTFPKQKQLWEPPDVWVVFLFYHSRREEVSEVETWMEGEAAVLYPFIGLSKLRNPKCHVGNGVRDRSLGWCLELGLKPGHPAASLTRLLTRSSASILLKKFKFHYYAFTYLFSTSASKHLGCARSYRYKLKDIAKKDTRCAYSLLCCQPPSWGRWHKINPKPNTCFKEVLGALGVYKKKIAIKNRCWETRSAELQTG